MELPINEKLVHKIQEHDFDLDEAIIFCFCVSHHKTRPGLLSYLIDKDVINKENEPDYRINLTTLDDDGNLVLRVPMYGKASSDFLFEDYISQLIATGFELTGYSTNMQKYTVLTTDEETQTNFSRLALLEKDFSIPRLVKATQKYYEQTEMAKNLRNFLATDAHTAYKMQQ
jgi:hypothetical protein